ncbi:uncharacterized protein L969DRAFT_101270 [Mixia osmundae IAM 14324]|uniref:Uncharacterized protein n=1 Tax=Mixia osmundae (strain CBS 9802 / IAM 14324 / JCM 22182 / KY 12970) TaxID=764103 RepID=G7DTH2_MIXOS|nr:uncharacterized protein L969DRAFT_101270 [Mixia osmundae IAM 14324]KEI42843.1 hypothetical protein L969DRAFT_101270 [Mixia osmundae IAM 14324]GAA93819.1 hypothetical protein E5Q_00465 [Mixia osmundae IAM 14324]
MRLSWSTAQAPVASTSALHVDETASRMPSSPANGRRPQPIRSHTDSVKASASKSTSTASPRSKIAQTREWQKELDAFENMSIEEASAPVLLRRSTEPLKLSKRRLLAAPNTRQRDASSDGELVLDAIWESFLEDVMQTSSSPFDGAVDAPKRAERKKHRPPPLQLAARHVTFQDTAIPLTAPLPARSQWISSEDLHSRQYSHRNNSGSTSSVSSLAPSLAQSGYASTSSFLTSPSSEIWSRSSSASTMDSSIASPSASETWCASPIDTVSEESKHRLKPKRSFYIEEAEHEDDWQNQSATDQVLEVYGFAI